MAKELDVLDDYLMVIGQFPVLKRFEKDDLGRILFGQGLGRVLAFERNEVIFVENSQSESVCWIIQGCVAVVRKQEVVTYFNQPGDYFGEMGIIDAEPRSASIIAVEETVLVEVDLGRLDGLPADLQAKSWGILGKGFAEDLTERLRRTTGELCEAQAEVRRLELANYELKKRLKELEAGG
jgi:CRP-like cAMP-binding protein